MTPYAPRATVRAALAEARAQTLRVVEPLPGREFVRQADPIVSPINWDVGHVGWFEELWLVHAFDGKGAMESNVDDRYVALNHERYDRGRLALPDRTQALREMRQRRALVLRRLDRLEPTAEDPLLADWFAHRMILNHERQHLENVLAALQCVPRGRYVAPRVRGPGRAVVDVGGMARVPAGAFPMGSPPVSGTYDNEWPVHRVFVPAFEIDRAPVTNGQFLSFMEDGGYESAEHWPEDSWHFFGAIGVRAPLHWARSDSGRWFVRRFDRLEPLPLGEPVMHVSWFEAAAFARWAGKRLPTEAEWEKAATWDAAAGEKRRYPWGNLFLPARANVGAHAFAPAPVGSYPSGASAVGCHQMIGDVWEWVADEFKPYAGYRAFPYDEYSSPFFGKGYRVLRGGSWATHPQVARGAFRNWAFPELRHIFAGFRCARSVTP